MCLKILYSSVPVITPHIIVKYTYVEDAASKRAPHRSDHLALARRYKDSGSIVMGGALADMSGANIVFRSQQEAELFVKEDPYVLHGVVSDYQMMEWSVVV